MLSPTAGSRAARRPAASPRRPRSRRRRQFSCGRSYRRSGRRSGPRAVCRQALRQRWSPHERGSGLTEFGRNKVDYCRGQDYDGQVDVEQVHEEAHKCPRIAGFTLGPPPAPLLPSKRSYMGDPRTTASPLHNVASSLGLRAASSLSLSSPMPSGPESHSRNADAALWRGSWPLPSTSVPGNKLVRKAVPPADAFVKSPVPARHAPKAAEVGFPVRRRVRAVRLSRALQTVRRQGPLPEGCACPGCLRRRLSDTRLL